jgi:hypothetical protein
MTTQEQYPNVLAAICLWREMRGQTQTERIAVKHVLLNRVAHPCGPFHDCPDLVRNILKNAYPSKLAAQFSSFNRSDPNSALLPNPAYPAEWQAFLECCAVLDVVEPDPTGGANYYHNYPEGDPRWPKWATPDKFTVLIGKTRFYKL